MSLWEKVPTRHLRNIFLNWTQKFLRNSINSVKWTFYYLIIQLMIIILTLHPNKIFWKLFGVKLSVLCFMKRNLFLFDISELNPNDGEGWMLAFFPRKDIPWCGHNQPPHNSINIQKDPQLRFCMYAYIFILNTYMLYICYIQHDSKRKINMRILKNWNRVKWNRTKSWSQNSISTMSWIIRSERSC